MATLVNEKRKEELLLVLLDEKQYIEQLQTIVKSLEKEEDVRMCYVCLNRPYKDVIERGLPKFSVMK